MSYIHLNNSDLLLGALLVLLNGGLSLALDLRLERQLFISAVRMVIQLTLVGLVLTTLFALVSPFWTAITALIMILFAGYEIRARQDRHFIGFWSYGLGTGAMLIASMLIMLFALTTQLAPTPWYDPRYAIPLLGMVLGNAMTGISLGLQTLTTSAVRERASIEARLTLGATHVEALLPVVRLALRSAFMPIINTMAATGVVALPGMMTGQILSGVEPVEAVKYQILVLFLISGGTGLGAMMAVLAGASRLTDHRHRLRLERLQAPRC